MKRCAQCHKKLGLGIRFRNIWNGHWWVHVRFCSVRCKPFMRPSETTPSNIAGTTSSLAAVRQAEPSWPNPLTPGMQST
jgi:hypothetical protein